MADKKEVLEWAVFAETKSVNTIYPDTDHDYDLFNVKIGEALIYAERPVGINLTWSDPSNSNNVRFARKSGSAGPIRYKEPIAINIRKGGWLVYKKREFGINLGWSETPKFEWRIDGGDPENNVVISGLIALYNSVEDDWLFYAPREFGVNLRWTADKGTRQWIQDAINLGSILKKYYDKP